MDPQFWRERWQNQDLGFHQPEYHGLLLKHWDRQHGEIADGPGCNPLDDDGARPAAGVG